MRTTILSLMTWVGLIATSAAHAGQVRLYPTAQTHDGTVCLRDVADVSGFPAEQAAMLERLIVGAAPRAGTNSSVVLNDIRAALDAAHVNRAEVVLMGAARCLVSTPALVQPKAEDRKPKIVRASKASVQNGKPLASVRLIATPSETAASANPQPAIRNPQSSPADNTTLESLLRAYLDDSVKPLGGKAETRFGAAQRAALALRTPECQFAIRPRGDGKLGMVWLDVEVNRAGQKPQTIPVMAEVTLLRPVVVATRVLNHGQEVSSRDVRMESRPFKRVEDVGMTDLAAVIGMEARRAIHPGDMVAGRDIRNKPLVARNQIVTVWSREGGLVVQTAGRATQEAWLGDVIEIRTEGSQEKFFATVSGPGTVTASTGAEVASR